MKRKTRAVDLGINLASRKEEELFKWLLVCLLFGKPIQTKIAEEAYGEIVAARLLSPDAILSAGWDKLVHLLDQAHYVRYDFSTATKLLEISRELKHRYGTVTNLVAQAKTPSCRNSRISAQSLHESFYAKCVLTGTLPAYPRNDNDLSGS